MSSKKAKEGALNKEGFAIVLGAFLSAVVLTAGALLTSRVSLTVLAVIGILFLGFSIYFFSRPRARHPNGAGYRFISG